MGPLFGPIFSKNEVGHVRKRHGLSRCLSDEASTTPLATTTLLPGCQRGHGMYTSRSKPEKTGEAVNEKLAKSGMCREVG
jgi:hypothetical protein